MCFSGSSQKRKGGHNTASLLCLTEQSHNHILQREQLKQQPLLSFSHAKPKPTERRETKSIRLTVSVAEPAKKTFCFIFYEIVHL